MNPRSFLAVALGLFGMAACGARTELEGTDAPATMSRGGSSASSTSSGPGTGGGETAFDALVTTSPDPKGPCFFGPPPSTPNPVYLVVSSTPITCDATTPQGLADYPTEHAPPVLWEICVEVDETDLHPGTVRSDAPTGEEDDDVDSIGLCEDLSSFSGGVSIGAVDTTSVGITLMGTDSATCGGTQLATDGRYTAHRCP